MIPTFVRIEGRRRGAAVAHVLTTQCVVVRAVRGDLYYRRRDGFGVGAAWGSQLRAEDLDRLNRGRGDL